MLQGTYQRWANPTVGFCNYDSQLMFSHHIYLCLLDCFTKVKFNFTTGISSQIFFHSTIIAPLKMSRVSIKSAKFEETRICCFPSLCSGTKYISTASRASCANKVHFRFNFYGQGELCLHSAFTARWIKKYILLHTFVVIFPSPRWPAVTITSFWCPHLNK